MVNSLLSAAEIHQVLREVLNGTNILAGQNWSISVLKSLCCNNLKPPEKLNSSWSLVRRAVQLDGGGAIGNSFEVLLMIGDQYHTFGAFVVNILLLDLHRIRTFEDGVK